VRVVVRRAGAERTMTLTRTTFAAADVSMESLSAHVGLLRVGAFSRGVGRQVRQVLAASPGDVSAGVVLDLRGNPGGLLTEAVEVASVWLDGGVVVSYERRGEPLRSLDALGRGDTRTPLVVLVDGGTASAAEVVAAALQERGRAVVVGAVTYGKGSVQEPARLSDGSALELTVGRYLTPSGSSWRASGWSRTSGWPPRRSRPSPSAGPPR
jgi:carboxyl-terminal processing protease